MSSGGRGAASPVPVVPAVGDRPLIGVIGGMGPAASVDLYAKLVSLAAASSDMEHVRVIIDGDPEVPDRQAAIAGEGPSAGPAIVAKALRLKTAGADVLAMACHAAHAYRSDIEQATGLPFVSLIDVAVEAAAIKSPGADRVGLLATPATLDARLYDEPVERGGRRLVTPDDLTAGRDRLMDLVWRVKAGDVGPVVSEEMARLASELVAAGAGVVIAACTEVPLVLSSDVVEVPLVDATRALAARLVVIGGARLTQP